MRLVNTSLGPHFRKSADLAINARYINDFDWIYGEFPRDGYNFTYGIEFDVPPLGIIPLSILSISNSSLLFDRKYCFKVYREDKGFKITGSFYLAHVNGKWTKVPIVRPIE